jgi:hypothetical protein
MDVISDSSADISSAVPYSYGPTLKGRKIRLLHILTGSGEEAINCSLVEASLDEGHVYRALSYTWGDCSQAQPICCDGRRLMVTESLHSALWRIREQKLASVLWADAVCINQSNDDEKTTQVRMMQDIYSQADTGIVWLGDSKDTDEAALELMEQVDNIFQDPKVSKTPNYHYIPIRRFGLPDENSPS